MFASLAEGKSVIRNLLCADDPMSTVNAFRLMGVHMEGTAIEKHQAGKAGYNAAPPTLMIHGRGLRGIKKPDRPVDCGNSGTTMRMLSGILAGQRFTTVLTGDASLCRRPMKRIIIPLSQMGARIESGSGGYPPLTIHGGVLHPITYESPVASAQVKSAVLLAGLSSEGTTTFSEPSKSRDHTERMLGSMGADISIAGLTVSLRGGSSLRAVDITIPGDFSSAAFFLVAALLIPGSELTIRDIGINPTRTGLIDILLQMGARITIENQRETSGEPVADVVVRYSRLTGIGINGEMVPRTIDEFPILCIAAAKASGKTVIHGAGELRVKESDRIAAMSSELQKMGVIVEEHEDGLTITGRDELSPAIIDSHGDHRVAMSMVIAGLLNKQKSTILDTACVNTSFPGFIDLLASLRG